MQTIEADPDSHQVQISLYPASFSRKVAGAGYGPGLATDTMRAGFWYRFDMAA